MNNNKIQIIKEQIGTYKRRYNKYLPAAFFVSGFLFDAVMLERIDNLFSIVQQTFYLLIVIQLLKLKILESGGVWQAPKWLSRVWRYSGEALNFFLGTLLNFYMLFYFVSSSLAVSSLFLLIVFGLLVLNESPRFQERSLQIKSVLLSVALFSFLFIIVTLAFGCVGYLPFTLSLSIGVLLFYFLYRFFKTKSLQSINLKHTLIYPPIGVAILLLLLYVFKILPPIPLSIEHIGIYHQIEKISDPVTGESHFKMSYNRSKWKFWQHGDQTFKSLPGDKIYCFVRVFAPANFKDKIYFHWLKKNRSDWLSTDRIPNEINGGREAGYRGYSIKSNYEPGEWRIQVETENGHEIGRINFSVEPADSGEPSEMQTQVE
jgi:hypothetical protein